MANPQHAAPHLFQPLSDHAETVGGSHQRPPATDAPPPAHGETEATRAVPSRELLTVEDAAARLAIGRTSMFALLRNRAIESVKVGRLRRVPADAITTYITRLTAEQRPATA